MTCTLENKKRERVGNEISSTMNEKYTEQDLCSVLDLTNNNLYYPFLYLTRENATIMVALLVGFGWES